MIAPSIAEAVRCAGGWLFDQVMAGWDVTVLTPDHDDARALQILGARSADLEAALGRSVRGACLRGIALPADQFGHDARIRQMVLDNCGDGLADIRLWADRWPDDLDGTAGPVRHQLSVAARAFKAQALAAVAGPAAVAAPDEAFRRFRAASAADLNS